MQKIEARITEFIHEHHILTLATSNNNVPYCCTCFYVYLDELNLFVVLSDKETKHIEDAVQQNKVSLAIALETETIGKIRGLQITGDVTELEDDERKAAKKYYLKRFPYAIFKKTSIWGIRPDMIKMTDNRLGFGKKIVWRS